MVYSSFINRFQKTLGRGVVHSSFINRFKKSSKYRYCKILRKKMIRNFERNGTFFVYKLLQKIIKISRKRSGTFFVYKSFRKNHFSKYQIFSNIILKFLGRTQWYAILRGMVHSSFRKIFKISTFRNS